jgi:hypothetical protein
MMDGGSGGAMLQLVLDLLLVVSTMALLTEAAFPGSVTDYDPVKGLTN